MRAPEAASGPPTRFKAGLERYRITARLFGDLRAYVLEYVDAVIREEQSATPQDIRAWTLEAMRVWLEVQ